MRPQPPHCGGKPLEGEWRVEADGWVWCGAYGGLTQGVLSLEVDRPGGGSGGGGSGELSRVVLFAFRVSLDHDVSSAVAVMARHPSWRRGVDGLICGQSDLGLPENPLGDSVEDGEVGAWTTQARGEDAPTALGVRSVGGPDELVRTIGGNTPPRCCPMLRRSADLVEIHTSASVGENHE